MVGVQCNSSDALCCGSKIKAQKNAEAGPAANFSIQIILLPAHQELLKSNS